MDFTKRPEDRKTLVDQMMEQRREEDKRRQPHKTDVNKVRNDMYAILKWRKEYEKGGKTGKEMKAEASKEFPEMSKTYPQLFDLALTTTNEAEFKQNINVMLTAISRVQTGVSTIEQCTDNVEMYLGKRYVKPKSDIK